MEGPIIPTARACGNCAHFGVNRERKQGECRHGPPTVQTVVVKGPNGEPVQQFVTIYPPVSANPNEFPPCGQWKAARLSA